jgi:hypothetical protein
VAVDDTRGGRHQRGRALQRGLERLCFARFKPLHRHAVRRGTLLQAVQRHYFGLIVCDDQLAAVAVPDAVPRAHRIQQFLAADAQLRLQ